MRKTHNDGVLRIKNENVGKNLQDHLQIRLVYEVAREFRTLNKILPTHILNSLYHAYKVEGRNP